MNTVRKGSPDFLLLLLTFLLVGFGLVMVFSASSAISFTERHGDALYYTKRQVMWAGLGTIVMMFFMNFHYNKLKKLTNLIFTFFIGLLILVLIIGKDLNGAKSWIMVGSIGIQPTEFAKVGIILYLAAMISRKGEKIRHFQKGLIPMLVVVGMTAGLIMLQPDLGSCMIFVFCSLLVIMAGGANLKQLFFCGSIAAVAGTIFVSFYLLIHHNSQSYRVDRFTAFMNPWADPLGSGLQLIQSLFAFGHGGLTGAGFGKSIQKLHYLPYAQNDFIFAIIAEELGFIGSALFILTFLGLIWRGIIIALRCPDMYGTLIGTGIVGMLGIQALINIGGVTGSIPITGVTLPFISSGGSSLLASMFSMGILLNISRESVTIDRENNRSTDRIINES